ncbi:Protein CBR-SRH-229 [Caenorhabditis briggsae]|uniref:Protein CBR-SRH-229 n=1 Tax=Caenorhabditis briggsae TaxID=6238 RepID=A8WNV6_CAEBR|nr:Protein CBR-SRH-229 [Caenorhabditis briggsae]CAP22162.1 Protein CBR-SRH-229 [Caenorhabditis briggsae]
MTDYCVASSQYLGDPEVYKLVFHILTCIEIPIHIYGAWCIIFKTSALMRSVKYLLLWSHFLSAQLDLLFSFISIPYMLLLSFSGYALGIFDQPRWEVYICLIVTAFVVTSILGIYENRFFVLYGYRENPSWCRIRKPFIAFNYFLAVIFIAPMYFLDPDQEIGFQNLATVLPCSPESAIGDRRIYVAFTDSLLPYIGLSLEALLLACEIVVFLVITISKLKSRDGQNCSQLSVKTKKLQKNFIKALFAKSSIPITFLLTPVLYVLVTMQLTYRNQNLSNVCVMLASSHGLFSTIVMVLVHQPYREATWNNLYFCFRCKRRNLKTTSGRQSDGIIKV